MNRTSPKEWFSIDLIEPYVIIPEQPSVTQRDHVNGGITLRLTKPTKIKSLSVTFSGYARTSFCFDTSSIPSAKPCISLSSDKHHYGSILIEENQNIFSSDDKSSNVLPIGTHNFPFSFKINDHLPAVISSNSINISYQVTASLQLASILPFGSLHNTFKPVILLQKDELPSDSLFNTAVMRLSSKDSTRVSCKTSIPCGVLPQAAIIPLMLNLQLKGNATTVTKITIELIESVFARVSSGPGSREVLIDKRVVTRQNCPVNGWPSSTIEEPLMIPKRLMFKVPELPISTWSKSEGIPSLSCPRSSLGRGFCHSSGTFAHSNIRITHKVRVIVAVRGLSDNAKSIEGGDSGESETDVWIVGNQEFMSDETNPPSYYRSFSTELVEGDKIQEIDQQAFEALQDDLICSAPPPCYEESFAGSSANSSPILRSWTDHNRSLDQFSLNGSTDDIASYTERYSYSNSTVLAM